MRKAIGLGILVYAIAVASSPSWGTVTATNIALSLDSMYYTVPAGKVLIVHNIFRNNTNNIIRFYRGADYMITIVSGTESHTWFHHPLVLTEENALQFTNCTEGDKAVILALLVDPADLYAAISCRFSNAMYADNEMKMRIELESPRPSVIAFDKSSDMVSWLNCATVPVAKEGTGLFSASDSALDPNAFYRARVRARR